MYYVNIHVNTKKMFSAVSNRILAQSTRFLDLFLIPSWPTAHFHTPPAVAVAGRPARSAPPLPQFLNPSSPHETLARRRPESGVRRPSTPGLSLASRPYSLDPRWLGPSTPQAARRTGSPAPLHRAGGRRTPGSGGPAAGGRRAGAAGRSSRAPEQASAAAPSRVRHSAVGTGGQEPSRPGAGLQEATPAQGRPQAGGRGAGRGHTATGAQGTGTGSDQASAGATYCFRLDSATLVYKQPLNCQLEIWKSSHYFIREFFLQVKDEDIIAYFQKMKDRKIIL